MNFVTRASVCMLAAALATGVVHAQQTQENQETPKPCSSEEARQFDFWIGKWDVHADGKLAGKSSIESILNGCTIYEQYDGVSGYSGKSFNVYDVRSGKWRQFWIDKTELLLQLEGGYADGKMVLSGSSLLQGEEALNRITWSGNSDGSVRQHWETSKDGGESWETAFNGRYTARQ